jgi:hypothetical protein
MPMPLMQSPAASKLPLVNDNRMATATKEIKKKPLK